MAKEQEVEQTSSGNEETNGPTTVVEKLQAIVSRGAVFNFGLPYDPPAKNKLSPLNLEQVQPTLQGGTIVSAHDGGPWVAFRVKRGDGREQQCRTRDSADAVKLKKLMDDPDTFRQGSLGNLGINIDPVGGLTFC